MTLSLSSLFIFRGIWIGSNLTQSLSLRSMIRTKDTVTEATQEYFMVVSPVNLTLVISKSKLGQKSLMKSSIFSLEMIKRVGLVSGKILSYDGTLFPTLLITADVIMPVRNVRAFP